MSRPTTISSALATLLAAAPVSAQPVAADAPAAEEGSIDAAADEEVEGGETIEIVDRAPPGARAELRKEELERDERNDLHGVLRGIAGVYVRDEDGYGLRPNIGMRGAAADRSSKVTLMEDGVLIAPAPYTAPAAYYAPIATRLSRVEVTKGPAAILFGPATVGGAVDLIGEPFPGERSAYVDVAGGTDRYGKLHARAAERREHWGVMAEYVHLRTAGFKELDLVGGDTGFAKNDVQVTGRVMSAASAERYHELELRIGYGDETSHETYTGLTDADFAGKPQRRYAGSQLDEMNWDHWRMRATHRLDLGLTTRILTTAYRHTFDRAWGKVDGFIGQRDFYGLLADPNRGANQVYYQVLTGEADTASPEEQLVLGTNDRQFTSQGIQSALEARRTTGPVAHQLQAGVRIHFDRADRRRYEDTYDMVSGRLVRTARPRATVIDSRAETVATAAYAQDTLSWRRLELAVGARVELIDFRFLDHLTGTYHDGQYGVLIPGAGLEYHLTEAASLLAGVHRGFVPVAPSAAAMASPESSINYEAGARWRDAHLSADVIGFFSDYSNLKGSCTLAAGCMETQDGEEYDGGAVFVYGAEVQASAELPLVAARRLTLPLNLAYTYTDSQFRHSFVSEFAGWGEVVEGDRLPYIPPHQLSLSASAASPRYSAGATLRWQAAMRDVAGHGAIDPRVKLDSLLTVDLQAHARVHALAELYVTCSNLLDEQVVISRRPYGARPNPPRIVAVGYKARF